MKEKLKRIYEKNNWTLPILYIIIKLGFIIFGKYNKISKNIKETIDNFESPDISKKDSKKLYKKLIVFRYIYLLRPDEYYLYGFENASYEERQKYMTRGLTAKYYRKINDARYRKVLDKKNLSYEVLKKYFKRELICVKSIEEKNELNKFINKNKKFIIKPFDGHSGAGVEIINFSNFKNIKDIDKYLVKKIPFVAEQLIAQSDDLGCFHKESVNTIRVVTFQYVDDFSILWCFLRTGQGESQVDNMGASGIGALIDAETGTIISDGVNWRGDKIKAHPDSNITFKGFKIPRWDELIETVRNLASELPEMHCVGWDLALTDNGWVLVEGNARPQCVTIQTFTKKGYKEYYDKMYNLVNKLNENDI